MNQEPRVYTISVGPFETNCYVVDAGNGRAIVIDPGSDAERIVSVLGKHRLNPCSILCTHGHCDHVSALAQIADKYSLAPRIHQKDLEWVFSPSNQLPPWFGVPARPKMKVQAVEDGQMMSDADLECAVIHTPGHSPGGACFHFPAQKILFSGDTLFQQSVGRTDFPGGDTETLLNSLRLLMALPDDTVVYAGHGAETTIGEERRNNPYLR